MNSTCLEETSLSFGFKKLKLRLDSALELQMFIANPQKVDKWEKTGYKHELATLLST
jgi:hypothetical protein